MSVVLATVYFQRPGAESYLPQLQRWVKHIEQNWTCHPEKHVMIATDTETNLEQVPIRMGQQFLAYFAMNLEQSPYLETMRPNYWMDRKEAIVLALVKKLGESNTPFLIVDLDTVFRVDVIPHFQHALSQGRGRYWAMCEDCCERTVRNELGHSVPERNAGVMWFGNPEGNLAIHDDYVREFERLKHLYGDSVILGQKVWSSIHSQAKHGTLLPKPYNWSHRWGDNSDAYISHFHGPAGKRKMELNGSRSISD